MLGFPIESGQRPLQNRRSITDDAKIKGQYASGFYIARPLTALPLLWLLIDSTLTRPKRRRKGQAALKGNPNHMLLE
jgi:hypothetical protein